MPSSVQNPCWLVIIRSYYTIQYIGDYHQIIHYGNPVPNHYKVMTFRVFSTAQIP